jgi:hypothetical protein
LGEVKKPVKRNTVILAAIALAVLLLCGCPIGVIGLMRSAAPTLEATLAVQEEAGATVTVKDPTKTPPTDIPIPHGSTREDPYPMNTPVDIGGDMEITILGVERPADAKVIEGNMFNDKPEAGSEYMLVTVGVKCNKPSNEKCALNTYEFKLVGADGQVLDQASVAGVHGALEAFPEFFGGSVLGGGMTFLVKQGDARTVLFYDPLFSERLVYFALQ